MFSLNKDDSWQVKCHLLSILYLFIYFYRGNKKIITRHLSKQNEGQPLPFLVARKLHRLKLLKCFTENFVNIRPCSCLMEKKNPALTLRVAQADVGSLFIDIMILICFLVHQQQHIIQQFSY